MKEIKNDVLLDKDLFSMQNNSKNSDRIYKIIRGIIKKELIKRLERQIVLFPISNKISIYYIDFYIIKRCYAQSDSNIKSHCS